MAWWVKKIKRNLGTKNGNVVKWINQRFNNNGWTSPANILNLTYDNCCFELMDIIIMIDSVNWLHFVLPCIVFICIVISKYFLWKELFCMFRGEQCLVLFSIYFMLLLFMVYYKQDEKISIVKQRFICVLHKLQHLDMNVNQC